MTETDSFLHNLDSVAEKHSRKGIGEKIKDAFSALFLWIIILTFFIPVIPSGGSWLWGKINPPQSQRQSASFVSDPDVQGSEDYQGSDSEASKSLIDAFAPEDEESRKPEYEDRDYDCGDFSTHAEAQDFFENAGAGDPHRLDRDGDGSACETLP
jgi:hypothetical protein